MVLTACRQYASLRRLSRSGVRRNLTGRHLSTRSPPLRAVQYRITSPESTPKRHTSSPGPGSHEPLVTHHAGGDDRHLFENGQPETSREEDEVDPEIGELLDERLKQLHECRRVHRVCQPPK